MRKKSTALFIVVMLLSTSFNLIQLAEPVKAANVCCQKTKAGDYCQFTSQDACDPAFRAAPALCENTNFCQLGCCNDPEGICFTNSPRSLCEAKGGSFSLDPNCNIPQCEKGACQIGNECSFATQSQCKAAAAKFENVGFKFDASIKSEQDAINICRSEEKGCCISKDSCSYTTRDSCPGDFNIDKFCSDSSLTCDCAPRSYKGCLPSEDDVYWFDSCGNPEAKAEECDYASGTICSQVESGDYKCISTSCIETYKSPASPDSGGTKRSGESWCVYDASVGFGSDVVGSRHYRATCINGEEIIEPCKDFRQEFCVSSDIEIEDDSSLPINPGSGKFTEAVCRTNRWQDCTSVDNQKDCDNQDLRDCFWFGNRCVPHVPPGFKFWEGEGTDICSQANQECTVLWRRPGIGLLDGLKPTGEARQWECVANCDCLSKDWLIGANNVCKALGDCGAYFNIAGDISMDGFSSNHKQLDSRDVGDWSAVSSGSHSDPEKQGAWQQFWDKAKLGVYVAGISAVYQRIISGYAFGKLPKGSWTDFFLSGTDGFKALGNKNKMAKVAGENYKSKLLTPKVGASLDGSNLVQGSKFKIDRSFDISKVDQKTFDGFTQVSGEEGLYEVTAKEGIIAPEGTVAAEGTVVQGASGFATAMQWINTIMWIYTIYQIADVLLADTKEENYTVSCEPWQALAGGDKCELCNTRGIYNGNDIKPCTEYECKSLGSGCTLLNQGSGNETCVYQSPKDTNSPIIQPLISGLPAGYSTTPVSNGYRINPEIKPFQELSFGVKTNEPSQCKITNQIGVKFQDMQTFLGGSLYSYNHLVSLKIPQEIFNEEAVQITNGGKYSFYVRCQDGNGNDNDQDYIIQFNVQPGPDLTPSSIDQTSIPNGGYARHGIQAANISFFTNEPASCRWSSTDTGYDVMQNRMTCELSSFNPSPNNLYECNTLLTGIRDDAVNRYFVRCQDKSNNTMQESYVYNLIGTIPLKIVEKGPSGRVANPVITVKTADGATKDGKAICGYGTTDSLGSMIQFFSTDSNTHSQPLALEDGTHTIFINCLDEAGNLAKESVTFTSFTDKSPPIITRIFQDRSLSTSVLHITTNELSICEFSSRGQFIFGKGTRMPTDLSADHEAPWGNPAYYIICADSSNNTGPLTMIYP